MAQTPISSMVGGLFDGLIAALVASAIIILLYGENLDRYHSAISLTVIIGSIFGVVNIILWWELIGETNPFGGVGPFLVSGLLGIVLGIVLNSMWDPMGLPEEPKEKGVPILLGFGYGVSLFLLAGPFLLYWI